MGDKTRSYVAIDLKSFYASVECKERKLDPLNTNLVVADAGRTPKTICLAVSPALKAYGIPGRARLFQVIKRVKEINQERLYHAPDHKFTGSSCMDDQLKKDPSLKVDYIVAPPRMAYYIEYSTKIYNIYLKYIAPEDIHVYSIDEVFMDVTDYLDTYQMNPRQLAERILQDVYESTGMTATAGIGTNLYLCKIAMDVVAKHMKPDKHGARIAELDEISYRRLLWNHRPLTDFWRIGKGYARKLEENGMYTMGDVARCSLGGPDDFYNEDLLYKLFGINAELLIDHAWGWEPCTIDKIKDYRPSTTSICSGQVLQFPYDHKKTRLVVKEMLDLLALDLVDKGLMTDQITLTIGYDIENLTRPEIREIYKGPIVTDPYGRKIPKHSNGTANLPRYTSSAHMIIENVLKLYDKISNKDLLVRRINLSANRLREKEQVLQEETYEQLDLFTDYQEKEKKEQREAQFLKKEEKMQQAVVDIKKKFGKNAILKGMNMEEGAMTRERNSRIGGHKA